MATRTERALSVAQPLIPVGGTGEKAIKGILDEDGKGAGGVRAAFIRLTEQRFEEKQAKLTWAVCAASVAGLIFVVVIDSLWWFSRDLKPDGNLDCPTPSSCSVQRETNVFVKGRAMEGTELATLLLEISLTVSTLMAIVLIVLYHNAIAKFKARKHMMSGATFVFWRSSALLWLVGEIIVHLLAPVPLMNAHWRGYQTIELLMLLRLYTIVRPVHASVSRYLKSFERNGDSAGAGVTMNWATSVKMIFYEHTELVLSVVATIILIIAGYATFVMERDSQYQKYANPYQGIWFAFVSFTTIGYGDMYPESLGGRVCTAMLGLISIIVVAIFGGVVTNKLAPSKEMIFMREYIRQKKAKEAHQNNAATLLQAVWREFHPKLSKGRRLNLYKAAKAFHSSRVALETQLKSNDPVLDQKIDLVTTTVEKLETRLLCCEHQIDLLLLEQKTLVVQNKEIMRNIASIAKAMQVIAPQPVEEEEDEQTASPKPRKTASIRPN